jgi:hypothetical protein
MSEAEPNTGDIARAPTRVYPTAGGYSLIGPVLEPSAGAEPDRRKRTAARQAVRAAQQRRRAACRAARLQLRATEREAQRTDAPGQVRQPRNSSG